MNILFVTNEIPYPPDNGIKIVSYNALRLMHEAGHRVSLAVLTEEISPDLDHRFNIICAMCDEPSSFWMPLPKRNKIFTQLTALLCGRLFFVERYRSKVFESRIKSTINSFQPDVIHFDLITMLQYIKAAPHHVGTVASINDSYALTLKNSLITNKYKPLEKIYRYAQYYHCLFYEYSFYKKFDVVHLMSKVDEQFLKKLNKKIKCCVIPNGVHNELFSTPSSLPTKKDIIFVAKLSGENLINLHDFLSLCWPKIHSENPNIKLNIVGQITGETQQLKDKYDGHSKVFFLGYVSNLSEIYLNCGIAIVPINKNCGIINKAIEAMAAGLAVIGFENTFSGLAGAQKGTHFIAVENYAEMAQEINRLIRDDSTRSTIGTNAFSFAKENYSWSTRKCAYELMYSESMRRKILPSFKLKDL